MSEDLDDDGSHLAAGDDELHLSGLHAKLYAAEFGNVTRVLIGSANATGPAWDGTNVEFMVELDAHLHDVCIDAVLGPDPDEDGQRLAASELRDARSFLLDAGLRAKASQAGEEFQLLLEAKRRPRGQWPSGVKARCWPVSLAEGAGRDVEALANGEAICFSPLSLVALTGMIGFELAAEHGDTRMADRFVLNLPTTGIPSARDRKVLADIIEKSGGFIRYLLMLLADETDPYDIVPLSGDDGKPGEGGRERGIGSLPLFEELVRTLSRDPAKITDIDRLVQDLLSDEESKKAIPEGFMDTWPMFIEVMEEIERRE